MEIAVKICTDNREKANRIRSRNTCINVSSNFPWQIHWIRLPIVSSVVSIASYDSLPVTRRYCYTANYSYLMSIKIVYGF